VNAAQKNRSAHEYNVARKHHTWKSFLMECRWEKLVQPPRRAKCPVPEPFPSMLELAKGFEPLTL
jgi:hypothetical protein